MLVVNIIAGVELLAKLPLAQQRPQNTLHFDSANLDISLSHSACQWDIGDVFLEVDLVYLNAPVLHLLCSDLTEMFITNIGDVSIKGQGKGS